MSLVHFDLKALELVALACEDEPSTIELVDELLVIFKTTSAQGVEDIASASKNQSSAEIGSLAHKLKSSCLALGFRLLADICAKIESGAKSGVSAADLQPLVQQIEPNIEVAVRELEAHLVERKKRAA